MRALAGHFASLGQFVLQHRQRAQADNTAFAELTSAAVATLGLPVGLELESLGVAGYRLSYEGRTIYVDPYLSRVPLSNLLRGRPALAKTALYDDWLRSPGEVLAVLVGHTHFDHAVDVPAICARYRCPAYGSTSLLQLMHIHGQTDRGVLVSSHKPIELGPFTVTFVPSLHSKLLLGYKVPSDGELTCEHLDALSPSAYRCGQVWGIHIEVAGVTFYHQGSANLIDEEIRHKGVDVFLAGIAGRRFTESYWQRILGALQPRAIVASHYDDFFRPLDGVQGFSLNVNLAAFPEEVDRVSGEFAVTALAPFVPLAAS